MSVTVINQDIEHRIVALSENIRNGKLRTLVPAMTLLLSLHGKPYSLENHFPFEPLFNVDVPRRVVLKTGRQVSKTTSLAARAVIMSIAIPYFNTVYIGPQDEHCGRFSTIFVKPFIEQSPFSYLWLDNPKENNVRRKTFKNYSTIFFTFAGDDATRNRGIPANQCFFDEVQNIDPGVIPEILEMMGGKERKMEFYTGTSLTLDTSLEDAWERSSQAEWCIPCSGCKYVNIPRKGYDLEKMIGPYHENISEACPGIICAKCGKPINPRQGRWIHRYENRKWSFAGYHVPQIILPGHYANKSNWKELVEKSQGAYRYTTQKFYNEVLGEAYDVSTKLINETDLIRAAVLPWENNPKNMEIQMSQKFNYSLRVLGVDWGGGGEDEISQTACAVLGFAPDGKLDVIYGEKLLNPADRVSEAKRILEIFTKFDCSYIAHDYNGAGSYSEAVLIQSGIPISKIMPMVYRASASSNLFVVKQPTKVHSRAYIHIDKARSLQLVCHAIKLGVIRFFKYDHIDADRPGLLHDFLALIEYKIPSIHGLDIYSIRRHPALSDDFAHAVNFAALAIWHSTQTWPNLAVLSQSVPEGRPQSLFLSLDENKISDLDIENIGIYNTFEQDYSIY